MSVQKIRSDLGPGSYMWLFMMVTVMFKRKNVSKSYNSISILKIDFELLLF